MGSQDSRASSKSAKSATSLADIARDLRQSAANLEGPLKEKAEQLAQEMSEQRLADTPLPDRIAGLTHSIVDMQTEEAKLWETHAKKVEEADASKKKAEEKGEKVKEKQALLAQLQEKFHQENVRSQRVAMD